MTDKPPDETTIDTSTLMDPDDWVHAWITAYTSTHIGNVSASCRAARINRKRYYDRLENDMAFATLVDTANEEIRDAIRSTMLDHALNGVEKPIVARGQIIGYIREYDHRMLMWLAERFMPEEFHLATKFELTGKNLPGAFSFALGEEIINGDVRELEPGDDPDEE